MRLMNEATYADEIGRYRSLLAILDDMIRNSDANGNVSGLSEGDALQRFVAEQSGTCESGSIKAMLQHARVSSCRKGLSVVARFIAKEDQ